MCKIVILSSIVDIVRTLLVTLVEFMLYVLSYYLLPDGFLVNKGFHNLPLLINGGNDYKTDLQTDRQHYRSTAPPRPILGRGD